VIRRFAVSCTDRWQASSHRFCGGPGICVHRQSLVGAGLPAKAVGLPASMLNVPTSSLASQLPQVLWRPRYLRTPPIFCRSWLASEGGWSANINAECAGQLPQVLWRTRYLHTPTIPCRSWLASEGGWSANINAECAGLFAGKPAPAGFVANPASAYTANPLEPASQAVWPPRVSAIQSAMYWPALMLLSKLECCTPPSRSVKIFSSRFGLLTNCP